MLVKNSIIYGGTTVIKGATSFLRIAIFTRLLNPAEYGDFAVVMALVAFIDAFAFLWIRQAVMRHITHEHTDQDYTYFTNALIIYGGLSCLCLLISLLMTALGILNMNGLTLVFELVGILVVTEAFSNLAILMARIRLHYHLFLSLNVIKPILSLIVGALLIQAGLGTSGALYGLLAGFTLSCIIGGYFIPDFKHIARALYSPKAIRAICTFGLPLIIVFSLQSAVRVTDRLLLDTIIGGDITGLYAAAQDIPFRLLNIIALAVHLAAYPLAVNAFDHKGKEACRTQLRTNFIFLFGIMCPAIIGMAVLAPGMAYIFVGEAFRPFAIQYFVFFTIISFLNCFVQYYFVLPFHLTKKTKSLIIPSLCGFVVNLIISYFGIRYWGVAGAITGSFLAYATVFAAVFIMGRNIFHLPIPWRATTEIILASSAMGAFVHYLNSGENIIMFCFSVLSGALLYAALILSFNTEGIRNRVHKLLKERAL